MDSIKYFNYDYSLQSEITYTYGAGGGDYTYQNGGYLNNISINSDNNVCQVKTIGSELPIGVNLATPWYYSDVTVRKIAPTSYSTLLTKDFFVPNVNGYGRKNNFLTTERISFRNNNLTDTLKIENYNYSTFGATDIDSMTVEWLKPGSSFLPTDIYYLDGIAYTNSSCNVLYNNPVEYGPIIPRKSLLLSTQTTDFDQVAATKKVTTAINTAYNSNWQKINDTKLNSKGTMDSTVYTYLYTNAGSLSTAVTNGNLFAPINKTISYTNSAYLGCTQTAYSLFNSMVLPDTIYYQQYASPSVLEGTVTGYDSLGRITEINKKAGFYSCLLRDYGNQSIIASVTNARLTDVAYTSFEADGTGTWTIGSASRDSTTALTGNKSFQLNSNISRAGLSSGTTYIVSYWTKNSSPFSITGTVSGYPLKGKSVILNDSTWTYYEHKVTGQTTISLSGTGLIDELRLYPDGAQMSTLTYNPLVGVSGQCDVDNRVTYYYYDGFNRLRYIKDQDGNIIKTYQYHYITQPN